MASSDANTTKTITVGDMVVELNGTEYPPAASFDDMELSDELLRGVYAHGFEKPSAIQSVGIVPIVKGRDILGQAQSGTGKTGTFGIGLLSRISFDPNTVARGVQALVLAPTHELADQIANVIRALGKHLCAGGVRVTLAVGGSDRRLNVREIREGAHIVVGTPGRVFDLAQSGVLTFASLRVFVLDEADEMLRDRFADQVHEIVKLGLPAECRIALFSATMPPEVKELSEKILSNPVRIVLNAAEVSLNGIKQYYVSVDNERQKTECLGDLYETLTFEASIIFCNTKKRAEELYMLLMERGFPVSVLHGELTQVERNQRMSEFRTGQTRVLIATNLLARGIDVQQVSVVFNFDVPSFQDKENYIHRVGRTGRYGRKGVAISFLTPAEKDVMDQIAKHYEFTPVSLPMDPKDVME